MVSWNCKHVQHVKIYLRSNFEVNLITHLGDMALFSSFLFLNFKTFRLIFQKLFRDRCKVYCKNVQHIKIYLPCNFEVNPITHFDRLCKLEKRGDEIKKKSSPLKLMNQLGGPLSKLCPLAPSCIQDGAITKNRNFFKWPKLLYFKPESAQIWTV